MINKFSRYMAEWSKANADHISNRLRLKSHSGGSSLESFSVRFPKVGGFLGHTGFFHRVITNRFDISKVTFPITMNLYLNVTSAISPTRFAYLSHLNITHPFAANAIHHIFESAIIRYYVIHTCIYVHAWHSKYNYNGIYISIFQYL